MWEELQKARQSANARNARNARNATNELRILNLIESLMAQVDMLVAGLAQVTSDDV